MALSFDKLNGDATFNRCLFAVLAKVGWQIERGCHIAELLKYDFVISFFFEPYKKRAEEGEEHFDFANQSIVLW